MNLKSVRVHQQHRFLVAVNLEIGQRLLRGVCKEVDALIGRREHGATVHNAAHDSSADEVARRDSACGDHVRSGPRVVHVRIPCTVYSWWRNELGFNAVLVQCRLEVRGQEQLNCARWDGVCVWGGVM